jgi:hypothetical protein
VISEEGSQLQIESDRVDEHAMPLVAVAIPTRNRAHLLWESLRSVLEQTLLDIEVYDLRQRVV